MSMFQSIKQILGLTPSTTIVQNSYGDNVESHIVGQVRPNKIGHIWTISNIRELCVRMKSGECVISPIFFAGVKHCHEWRLILYPCGDKVDNAKYVSLYLQLVSDAVNPSMVPRLARLAVKTTIQLSIINADGEQVNRLKPTVEYHFVKEKTLWGYGKFISHDKLLSRSTNNPFLCNNSNPKNARLIIFCDHMDCDSTNHIPVECNLAQISAVESIRKLSSDFEVLLRNRDQCDVTIETSTKKFPAHKIILSARSPVFAATFAHNMREKSENLLFVEDVRAEIMSELLLFIYTGTVMDLEGNVMELLVVADKYALDDLKNMCEEVLFNSLSIGNALELLIFADMHNATKLKARITQYIIVNSKDVAKSRNFNTVMQSHPLLIAQFFENLVLQN